MPSYIASILSELPPSLLGGSSLKFTAALNLGWSKAGASDEVLDYLLQAAAGHNGDFIAEFEDNLEAPGGGDWDCLCKVFYQSGPEYAVKASELFLNKLGVASHISVFKLVSVLSIVFKNPGLEPEKRAELQRRGVALMIEGRSKDDWQPDSYLVRELEKLGLPNTKKGIYEDVGFPYARRREPARSGPQAEKANNGENGGGNKWWKFWN